jgi:hypothetical protein
MKRYIVFVIPALLLGCAVPIVLQGQDYPKAEITNGLVRAGIYLPDAEKGYYRATRFDWSGVIYRLEYKGHNYFSPWQAKHDPLVHNSISGPVDTFEANIGYQEAAPGGLFVRIGVGLLQKPEDPKFRPGMMSLFKVVDPGKWKIRKGKSWIELTQEIPDRTGYAYRYVKQIRLERGKPEMTISHTLKNTGSKVIETTGYNHNFFVIDGQPSGPGFVVKLAFDSRAKLSPDTPLAQRGREFYFTRELQGQQATMAVLEGFGPTAADHEIVIENQTTGAAVRIKGDRPLHALQLFFRRPNVCPETFFRLRIEPGKTEKWQARYTLYTLK